MNGKADRDIEHEGGAALISFFLIEPVEAHIAQRYANSGIPPQKAAEAAACFSAAAPDILDRAGREPAWAIYQAAGYWTGALNLDEILSDVAPYCATTVQQTPERSI